MIVLNPGRRKSRFKEKIQLCPSVQYINYGKDAGKRKKGKYGSEGRLGENIENGGTYIQKVTTEECELPERKQVGEKKIVVKRWRKNDAPTKGTEKEQEEGRG